MVPFHPQLVLSQRVSKLTQKLEDGKLPVLLIGGSNDGVIASSSTRYGAKRSDPSWMIRRTFQESVHAQTDSKQSYLVLVKGANHFSIVDKIDKTTARSFLDWSAEGSAEKIRSLLSQLIISFLTEAIEGSPHAVAALLTKEQSMIEEQQQK